MAAPGDAPPESYATSQYSQFQDEGQRSNFDPNASSYQVPQDNNTPSRPSGLNLNTILMFAGIGVLGLMGITGLIGLIKLGGHLVTGGAGINDVNIPYLSGCVMFFFMIYAAAGILAELRIGFLLSQMPALGTFVGKAVWYFWLALHALGIAGDLGIAVGSFLLLLAVLNGVAFFLSRN